MKPSSDELEKLIHRTLRSLPDRRAPRAIQEGVLAGIQSHRPPALRRGFIALSAAIAVALCVAASSLLPPSAFRLPPSFEWLSSLQLLDQSLAGTAGDIVRAIPESWLYVALAALAACYALLLGVGAAAYRIFFKP